MLPIEKFRNLHPGCRCWIVGNGPSLNGMDLSFLQQEISFGTNCIFLGFEKFGFRPTYYTIEDIFVAEDNSRVINQMTGMVKFVPQDLSYCLQDDACTCWVEFVRLYKPYPQFSPDAGERIFWGSTVTYLAIQLAYYMGCDPLYLIGVDFDYQVPPYAQGQEEITSREDDVNHFHPGYFGPGKRWHHPRLDRVEPSYREALNFLSSQGRGIYNAGIGGKLEIFPRVDYKKVIHTSPVIGSVV